MKLRYVIVVLIPVIGIIVYAIHVAYLNSDFFFKNQSREEVYGQIYNGTRDRLGIPILPNDWYTKDTSTIPTGHFSSRRLVTNNHWLTQIWSSYSTEKPDKPYHKEKEIRRLDDKIKTETDRFVFPGDSIEYLLELRYSYLGYNEDPWECSLVKLIDSDNTYDMSSVSLTIEQADSVLDAWRLSRKLD